MKKNILTAALMVLFFGIGYSQKTVEKIVYWDYAELRPKEVWHELGNGVKHGSETTYDESGRKWMIREFDNGMPIKSTRFYQDGEIMYEGNHNRSDNIHGLQKWYAYFNGTRFLGATANAENGVLLEFKHYVKPNVLDYEYINNGGIKKWVGYDSDGNKFIDVILENGKISAIGKSIDMSCEITNNHIIHLQNEQISAEGKDNLLNITINNDEGIKKLTSVMPNKNYRIYEQFYSAWTMDPPLSLAIELKQSDKTLVKFNDSKYDFNNSITNLCFTLFNATVDVGVVSLTNKVTNKLIYEKNYDQNGTFTGERNYNENGELLSESTLDQTSTTTKYYTPDGILKKEEILDRNKGKITKIYNTRGQLIEKTIPHEKVGYVKVLKFVYNDKGELIDSTELQEELTELFNKYNWVNDDFERLNNEINKVAESIFCIDLKTSNFSRKCYNKKNENIYKSFQVLWIGTENKFKEVSKNQSLKFEELGISEIDWESDTQVPQKVEYLKIIIPNLEYLHRLNLVFSKAVERYKVILASEDYKEINVSLANVSDPNRIKSIIGVQ